MGPISAWKLSRIVDNLAGVLAIEAMCAAQAMEFHRPLASSQQIEKAIAIIRTRLNPWTEDRFLQPDIAAVLDLLEEIWKSSEEQARDEEPRRAH
jgi:histidine ammonia-lyase